MGISNTLVSYLLNLFCLFVLDKYDVAYDYVIANTVSFILSVLWSFFWNERLVFYRKTGQLSEQQVGTLAEDVSELRVYGNHFE